MPRLPFLIACASLAWSGATLGAPHAQSALECGIAADMAVVAHSLAKEQIQRAKADGIMTRIYDVAQSDRGRALMKEILDAAYIAKGPSGQKFAEELFATCMKSGGDMDPVLGGRKL